MKCPECARQSVDVQTGIVHRIFFHRETPKMVEPIGAAAYCRTMRTSDGLVYWVSDTIGWTSIPPRGL